MSATQYPIVRWDVVQFGSTGIVQFPMIYIKPDTALLEQARKTNFVLQVRIEGTDKVYDGQTFLGTLDRSANTPSCRPNYYAATGLYVVTLDGPWEGYPAPGKLGRMELLTPSKLPLGETPKPPPAPPAPPAPSSPTSSVHPKTQPEDHKGLNTAEIVAMSLGFAAVLGVLIWLAFRK